MADPGPSSPTNSSPSSSDFDTESTGSFFHDTSTTLGNLMGVSLQAITFRAQSQHRQNENPISPGRKNKKRKAVDARRRKKWWMLCREESDARRASLGEYLEIERRFADGGAAVEMEEGVVRENPSNGRALFADGRVLPPVEVVEDAAEGWCSCRLSGVVSFGGICSGGAIV